MPEHFINRSDEISQLDRILGRDGLPVVIVCGPGGVGKTALAVRWATAAQARFPDGQLYVDLDGFGAGDPLDPGEALGGFLRALGVAPQQIPARLAEQAALYRTVTTGRSLILLLDNAATAAQVRALMPAKGSAVLVTSRHTLTGLIPDGAQLLEVPPLPMRDSIELLTRTLGPARITTEREQAESLAEICAGLPIALCIAAARLAARPRLSLRSMVADLADDTIVLSRLSIRDGQSVRGICDMSYRSLPTSVAALYRRLALHPGPEFGADAVAALLAVGPEGDRDPIVTVDHLLGVSLLQEISDGRFRFHDLLRLHARERADHDDAPSERDRAQRAMLEYYLAAAQRADLRLTPYRRRIPYEFRSYPARLPELACRQDALDWLARERVNLIRSARTALDRGWPDLSWLLADALWPLMLFQKHYSDRLAVDEQGVRAARQWGNAWAEAVMLKRLGRSCSKFGETADAERHTRAAIDRYRDAGDVRGRLDAEEGLAAIYQETGRDTEALDLLGRLLASNRDLGDDRSTGLTCIRLGTLLTRVGRPAEALPVLRDASSLFARIQDVDPYNGARVLIALAAAQLGIGDPTTAEQTAARAGQEMAEMGSDHERAEAIALLGDIAWSRGDPTAARGHYREARDIFAGLQSPRVIDLERALGKLYGPGRERRSDPAGPSH